MSDHDKASDLPLDRWQYNQVRAARNTLATYQETINGNR